MQLGEKPLNAIARARDAFRAKHALVFGSYARGEATSDSDVDVCFIFEKIDEDPLDLMYKLRRSIHENCDDALDVLVFETGTFAEKAAVPNTLENTICMEGIAL